jgi:hypothetical protein
MDASAQADCEAIRDLLVAFGLSPVLRDDNAPGVPVGVYAVQVPAAESARADEVVAGNARSEERAQTKATQEPEVEYETIYSSEGAQFAASVEVEAIKSLLEANGITPDVVGDSVLPNFPVEVRVPRQQAEQAKALIEQAQAGGPAAAAEAELLSETELDKPV